MPDWGNQFFEEEERAEWGHITHFFASEQQPVTKIPNYLVMDHHAEKKDIMHPEISPWVIIGSVGILLIISVVLTYQNDSREKKHMSRILRRWKPVPGRDDGRLIATNEIRNYPRVSGLAWPAMFWVLTGLPSNILINIVSKIFCWQRRADQVSLYHITGMSI